MKPTSSFRILKQTKRYMALMKFANQHDRGEFKRSSIQAQLASEQARRSKMDKNSKEYKED